MDIEDLQRDLEAVIGLLDLGCHVLEKLNPDPELDTLHK
jgi:hypothetical protein